jgi:hypothetical protein
MSILARELPAMGEFGDMAESVAFTGSGSWRFLSILTLPLPAGEPAADDSPRPSSCSAKVLFLSADAAFVSTIDLRISMASLPKLKNEKKYCTMLAR